MRFLALDSCVCVTMVVLYVDRHKLLVVRLVVEHIGDGKSCESVWILRYYQFVIL